MENDILLEVMPVMHDNLVDMHTKTKNQIGVNKLFGSMQLKDNGKGPNN